MKQRQHLKLYATPLIIVLVIFVPFIFMFYPQAVMSLLRLCYLLPVVYLGAYGYQAYRNRSQTAHDYPSLWRVLGIIGLIMLIQVWLAMGFASQTLLIYKLGLQHHFYSHSVKQAFDHIHLSTFMDKLIIFPGLFITMVLLLMRQAYNQFNAADFMAPRSRPILPFHTRVVRRFLQTNTFWFISLMITFIAYTIAHLIMPSLTILQQPHLTYLLIGLFTFTLYAPAIKNRLKNFRQRQQTLQFLGIFILTLVINYVLIQWLINNLPTHAQHSDLLKQHYQFLASLQSPAGIALWFFGWWLCGLILPLSALMPYIQRHHPFTLMIGALLLPTAMSLGWSNWVSQIDLLHQFNPTTMTHFILIGQILFAVGWGVLLMMPHSSSACLWFGYFPKNPQKPRATPPRHLALTTALITFLIGVFNLTSIPLLAIPGCLSVYVLIQLSIKTLTI